MYLSTHIIKVDVDGADVGGAHCRHAEEAVPPSAGVDGALVVVEEALEPARHTRLHAEQLTWGEKYTAVAEIIRA